MSCFLDEIETCIPALRRYARALTRSAGDADDLVQDCLERAIRKQALFRPTGPLRPWLFKVLLNIYRNAARDKGRQPQSTSFDLATHDIGSPAGQISHLTLAELARSIDLLPLDQREALLLVVLEGLNYSEAAKILDIPMGTLMSRLGRARASLRATSEGTQIPHLRTVK